MLTKYDEFLCHQTAATFDNIETSAREWTERIWFSAHDSAGAFQLVTGFGLYPNRNIMDCFACFVVEGKTQYAVRASRELRPAYDDLSVGPFSYEVTEPFKRVRLALGDNDYGLSFDIVFNAAMNPHEEEAQFARTRGRVVENIKRYVQVGRASGWIQADGKKIGVDESIWLAERDHSWGIRQGGMAPETGVQPREIPQGYLYNFMLGQFGEWGATYHIREDWDGTVFSSSGAISFPCNSGSEELKITSVDHSYIFKKDMRQINGGKVVLGCSDGSRREISVKPISVCYIKAGGYFGFRDFVHGLWMGPYYIDGHKLDLTDPQTVRELSFIDDVLCELRCGDETGYGIVEMVVVGKYPKYGYESF